MFFIVSVHRVACYYSWNRVFYGAMNSNFCIPALWVSPLESSMNPEFSLPFRFLISSSL